MPSLSVEFLKASSQERFPPLPIESTSKQFKLCVIPEIGIPIMSLTNAYVIEPAAQPILNVAGDERVFPVNEIFCVGRNYADHAIEMGGDPNREPPFFFMKPGFAILGDGGVMEYPAFSNDVHHEVELVVALGQGGTDVSEEEATSLIFGYGVGIDMTRRDLQSLAKEKSQPWEAGKTFRHSAPCSNIVPIAQTGELTEGAIWLEINGERRQTGNINQMIWKVPEIIARLSSLFTLAPGDLIYTGTPAGVGPVQKGDAIVANIEAVGRLNVSCL